MAYWDNHPHFVRHGAARTSMEYGIMEQQHRLNDLTTIRDANDWTTLKSQNLMPCNVPAMARWHGAPSGGNVDCLTVEPP